MKFEKQAKASSCDGIVNRKGADKTFIPGDQLYSAEVDVKGNTLYISEWESIAFRTYPLAICHVTAVTYRDSSR